VVTPPPPTPTATPPVSQWANTIPGFTDELHLIGDLNGGHAAAADYVFQRGRETGFEHMAVVENGTGRIVHAGTMGDPDSIRFHPFNVHGSIDGYTVHHNHPNDSALSWPDGR
jgi:hypothetical protein